MWRVLQSGQPKYLRDQIITEQNAIRPRKYIGGRLGTYYRPTLKQTQKTWKFNTINIWNNMSLELRTENTEGLFRKKIHIWVSNNIKLHREGQDDRMTQ